MRPNPANDLLTFLTAPAWTTAVYWLLLVASIGIAALVLRRQRTQRDVRAAGVALLRLVIGGLWWQQSLWKIPPNYGGLVYWMNQMVAHAAIPLQGRLVHDLVVPNIGVFGPIIYLAEVAIGVSLMLGMCTRLGALAGAAMAANLWLGLYSAPGEWPWTYFFLIVIQLLFVIDPPGRCLGLDAVLRAPGRRRHGVTVAVVALT